MNGHSQLRPRGRRAVGSSRWLWPLALACGLASLAFAVARLGPLPWNTKQEIEYGDAITSVTLKDAEEHPIELGLKTWRVLLFVNLRNAQDVELLDYLGSLIKSGRLQTSAFTPVVVTDDSRDIADSNRARHNWPNRLYLMAENRRALKRAFSVARTQRKCVLVDPSGRVAFAASFLQKNDLRLLLEQHFFRPGEYAGPRGALRVGDSFPEIGLEPIDQGIRQPIPTAPHAWVVFTAKCTSCSLTSGLEVLRTCEPVLTAMAGNGTGASLLFSRFFDKDDTRRSLSAVGISVPAFIATTDLYGLEDSYLQQPLGPYQAMVVETDASNTIRRLESLRDCATRNVGGNDAHAPQSR